MKGRKKERGKGRGGLSRVSWSLSVLLTVWALMLPGRTMAQTSEVARVEALAAERQASQRRHLWRVGAWGSLNLLGGAALMLASDRQRQPTRRGFGLQAGLWGAVNLSIAGFGLLSSSSDPTSSYGEVVSAERGYHDILLLNMGLNVAYAAMGTAMVVAGYRDVRSAASWRGHGLALILQGAGLLVLDGISLVASRSRLGDLLGPDFVGVAGGLSGMAFPGGVSVVIPL